eukprot:TRINITY_DN4435_c0_g2_i2.p1 TRINITY_DN4435_c0_g2~~TRINITY_DN4435_c0_g2_i2.p1  ORF type:complete len:144 (+),score=27.80 TRINITY_DN4435_c0_g2_i2:246-677(+)
MLGILEQLNITKISQKNRIKRLDNEYLASRYHYQSISGDMNELERQNKYLPEEIKELESGVNDIENRISQLGISNDSTGTVASELEKLMMESALFKSVFGLAISVDKGGFKFCFSHIDPDHHDREFVFSLHMNDEDRFFYSWL